MPMFSQLSFLCANIENYLKIAIMLRVYTVCVMRVYHEISQSNNSKTIPDNHAKLRGLLQPKGWITVGTILPTLPSPLSLPQCPLFCYTPLRPHLRGRPQRPKRKRSYWPKALEIKTQTRFRFINLKANINCYHVCPLIAPYIGQPIRTKKLNVNRVKRIATA